MLAALLPDDDVFEMLGELAELQRRGGNPEASPLWAAAERASRDAPDMLLCLAGVTLSRRNDERALDDGLEYVARAVALAPDDPAVLMRAASVRFDCGEVDAAWELALRAAALAKPHFVLGSNLLHLLGCILLVRGERDAAREALATAFEADPADLGHGRVLAEVYAEDGEREKALDVISIALEHRPDDADLIELRRRLRAADR